MPAKTTCQRRRLIARLAVERFLLLCAAVLTAAALTLGGGVAQAYALGHITGTIVDGSGPAAGIRVTALQLDWTAAWMPFAETLTLADGTYDLSVPAGTYRLFFSDATGLHTPECYNDVADSDHGVDIVVADGATVGSIDATLISTSVIAGTVRSASGIVDGITVEAYLSDGGGWVLAKSTGSDADGKYRVTGLAAGTYRLRFWDPSARYGEEYWNDSPTADGAIPISLSGGVLDNIDPILGATDTTPPATTSNAVGVYSGTAHISLFVTDGGGVNTSPHYILDGGPETSGYLVTVSTLGQHTLEFWSVDMVGNVESRHSVTFMVVEAVPDNTPPTTYSNVYAVYSGAATITLTPVDNAGGVGVAGTMWRIDGTDVHESTTVTCSTTGNHTLQFWSWDSEGNQEAQHFVRFVILAPGTLMATDLSIHSSATSARIGGSFVLSGVIVPNTSGLVGIGVHVDVKKPGKTYWSYSSNRITYLAPGIPGGTASWWYRYGLKRGMARGTYAYRCVFNGNASFGRSTSATVKVTAR